jgi:hypothetical protein
VVEEPGVDREHPLHVSLRRARPHDAGPWFAAEQQIQGVREHSLPGTRLARDDVQAGFEPQLGALDQEEVLDSEL